MKTLAPSVFSKASVEVALRENRRPIRRGQSPLPTGYCCNALAYVMKGKKNAEPYVRLLNKYFGPTYVDFFGELPHDGYDMIRFESRLDFSGFWGSPLSMVYDNITPRLIALTICGEIVKEMNSKKKKSKKRS